MSQLVIFLLRRPVSSCDKEHPLTLAERTQTGKYIAKIQSDYSGTLKFFVVYSVVDQFSENIYMLAGLCGFDKPAYLFVSGAHARAEPCFLR